MWRALSRAAAKAAGARLRGLGALRTGHDWTLRAETCERCPLRSIHRGVSYCGTPFMRRILRDEAVEGCGCPCNQKAKDPAEHCPIDARQQPAQRTTTSCNCRWCTATSPTGASRHA